MQHNGRAHKMLLVEDDDFDAEIFESAASRLGRNIEIVRAQNGRDALEKLRAHAPDFVVMDLSMPVMDGKQALAEIRMRDEFMTMPVIIMSSSSNADDMEFCYGRGASAYVTTPSSIEEANAIVAAIFSFWVDAAVYPLRRQG